MTDTTDLSGNPVARLRAVRAAIAAETAKLPAVDANGTPLLDPDDPANRPAA